MIVPNCAMMHIIYLMMYSFRSNLVSARRVLAYRIGAMLRRDASRSRSDPRPMPSSAAAGSRSAELGAMVPDDEATANLVRRLLEELSYSGASDLYNDTITGALPAM